MMHIFSKQANTIKRTSKEKGELKMKKNNKLMIVFILVVAFLLLMVTCTKATNDVAPLPTIVTGNNETNNQTANNETSNNVEMNTELNNNTLNISENTDNNTVKNDTLPQTGVQEDTTLFIFIGICIISAIYAYFKIKKYNSIH